LIIVIPGSEAQSAGVDLKIIPEDRRATAVTAENPSAAEAP
jgi:hypothetical protein